MTFCGSYLFNLPFSKIWAFPIYKSTSFKLNLTPELPAIHGCDPNWGRIISAAGNSGVEFNLNYVDLYIGNAQILEKGKLNKYDPQKVTDYIKSRMKGRYLVDDIVKIMINLNSGESKGTAWGCDLSKKYVEINSEYTT